MKRLAAPISLVAALAAACALSGCQQIFTTSLAKSLARDTIPLPADLSASQASSLIEEAKANQNTKLATALVDNLVSQVGNTTTITAENAALAAAAAGSAVVASGAATVTMSALKTFVEGGATPTGDDLVAIVDSLKAGTTDNVKTALMYLSDSDALTAATAEGTGTMSATDCAIAAIVLAASALPAGQDPTTLAGDTSTVGTPLYEYVHSPEVIAAKAIIDQAKTLVTNADLLNQFSDMLNMS